MEANTRIVILGGGYGGVEAALALEKRFRRKPDVDILLIDKNGFHTLMTELHEVAGWRTEPDSVQVSFRKIFGGRRVRVAIDKIETVDFEARVAKSASASYPYEYLVIGSGAEPEYFDVPGVKANAFTLWSFDDAMTIRRHVEDCFRKAESETDPAKRKRLLRFVVAGAGFTGIELAGEFLEMRGRFCEKHGIEPADVEVAVVEALPSILPMLEDKLRAKAERYLAKLGAIIMTNSPIVKAEPGKVILKDGGIIETETFVWTCGVRGSHFAGMLDITKGRCSNRACEFVKNQGTCGVKDCAFKKTERDLSGKGGRLLANEFMESVDYPNVYVVGDNLWFLEDKKPLPQIVETALQTAEVAAKNIIASIEGSAKHPFKSNYHGFMVSVGGKWAVSNAGGMKLSGIPAMAMKHLVNLHYLFGIAGVNQCWEYLKHEFLDMRDGRSITRGLLSYKIRPHWGFLLRLWLGFSWIVEATNKITEGWLNFDGKSRSAWLFSKGVLQAGTDAAKAVAAQAAQGAYAEGAVAVATPAPIADAVAAASEAWDTVAASTPAPVVDALSAASEAWDAGTAAVADAANVVANAASKAVEGPWLDPKASIIPYNSPLATWFRQTFMDGIFASFDYGFFQAFVVIVELLIGLALFGGLFTWGAALLSIGLCLAFTLSGIFAWNQLWFIFAAILMLGGAGRSLGLDHWFVPFAKKLWKKLGFVKRHRLYTGEASK